MRWRYVGPESRHRQKTPRPAGPRERPAQGGGSPLAPLREGPAPGRRFESAGVHLRFPAGSRRHGAARIPRRAWQASRPRGRGAPQRAQIAWYAAGGTVHPEGGKDESSQSRTSASPCNLYPEHPRGPSMRGMRMLLPGKDRSRRWTRRIEPWPRVTGPLAGDCGIRSINWMGRRGRSWWRRAEGCDSAARADARGPPCPKLDVWGFESPACLLSSCKPRASGGTAYESTRGEPGSPRHQCGRAELPISKRINCGRLPGDREPRRGCAGSYFTSTARRDYALRSVRRPGVVRTLWRGLGQPQTPDRAHRPYEPTVQLAGVQVRPGI